MTNSVKAEMFIIPNPIVTFGSLTFKEMVKDRLNLAGIDPTEDMELVQVWITGSGSNNWADHKDPITHNYFTSRLPLEMLKNIKEGETITLDVKGVKVELTARQLSYRYKRFGKFEEVLEKLAA